jgi:hypothetical protein
VLAGLVSGLVLLGRSDAPEPAPTPVESAVRPRPERPPRAPRSVVRAAPPAPAPIAPVPEIEAEALAIPEGEDGFGMLVVDVVDEDGRPAEDAMVLPVRCEGFEPAPPGEYRVATGPCALRAVRRDGALLARGPITTVSVEGPDPAYIQLVLSGRRTGGIGIRFQPSAEGIRVLEVVPGSPAFAAGLESGDLILAVGGEPVSDMSTDEFVERMTGAEGTDVDFTLGLSSDTGVSEETLSVTRAFLEG